MRLWWVIAALAVSGPLAAQAPTRDIATSWGKAGVSMVQYRLDAGTCTAKAMSIDLAGTPTAKRMVDASRALDDAYAEAWTYSSPGDVGVGSATAEFRLRAVRDRYHVADGFTDIRQMQTSVLEGCLRDRGYQPFALTAPQRSRLKHLRLGSDKRRAYLHDLASDPAVLAAQHL